MVIVSSSSWFSHFRWLFISPWPAKSKRRNLCWRKEYPNIFIYIFITNRHSTMPIIKRRSSTKRRLFRARYRIRIWKFSHIPYFPNLLRYAGIFIVWTSGANININLPGFPVKMKTRACMPNICRSVARIKKNKGELPRVRFLMVVPPTLNMRRN